MSTSNKHYTSVLDWDFILEKINEEKCLLVLGPEVFIGKNGVSYDKQLLEHIAPANNPNILRFYESDGFFLFDNPSVQTKLCHQIKKFYRDKEPSETLQQLAEIPFHIILTVTPNMLLNKAIDEHGFNYQFGHYRKNKEPRSIMKPTKHNPLVYNLFGCLESDESLILTHNDLYDYFKSIFGRKSMPQLLKERLQDIRNILFLGVPFDKWYMQLLLRELEIHDKSAAFLRFAANQSITDEIKTFCTEQFEINFIFDAQAEGGKNISRFVNDLYKKCELAGILREKGATHLTDKEKIKQYIMQAKLEEAFDLLAECTMGSELEGDVLMLAGRYRNFKRRSNNNLLRENEREVQYANIVESLISFADQLIS
ncbi:MAG: SIR2 family protein [Bacteroidota bacterium]